jgi:hypothetical protein
MDITQFANDQRNRIQQGLQALAYERLMLTKKIDEIDERMKALAGADEANSLVRSEIETNAAVEEAKAAANNKIGEK